MLDDTPMQITDLFIAYAVAMDFIMALAPCFIIWELNMKRKEKVLIMSGLSLGVL